MGKIYKFLNRGALAAMARRTSTLQASRIRMGSRVGASGGGLCG
jgi:hypothetical protein